MSICLYLEHLVCYHGNWLSCRPTENKLQTKATRANIKKNKQEKGGAYFLDVRDTENTQMYSIRKRMVAELWEKCPDS